MDGPYPWPQKSNGLHKHLRTVKLKEIVHSHRTYKDYHGHDRLPAGAGIPVPEPEDERIARGR